jgi:hypothetical protein
MNIRKVYFVIISILLLIFQFCESNNSVVEKKQDSSLKIGMRSKQGFSKTKIPEIKFMYCPGYPDIGSCEELNESNRRPKDRLPIYAVIAIEEGEPDKVCWCEIPEGEFDEVYCRSVCPIVDINGNRIEFKNNKTRVRYFNPIKK